MASKHRMLALAVAAVAVGLYLGVRPFVSGNSGMKAFCESLSTGMGLQDIDSRAKARGYKVMPSRDGQQPILIVDSAAMGRFICQVRTENDRLVSTRYILND